jgi:hypothetical protein
MSVGKNNFFLFHPKTVPTDYSESHNNVYLVQSPQQLRVVPQSKTKFISP